MQRRLLLVAVCFLTLGSGCDDDEDTVVDAGRGGAGGGAGGGGGQAGAGGRGGAGGNLGSGGASNDAGDARPEVTGDTGDTGETGDSRDAGDGSDTSIDSSPSAALVTASAGGTVVNGGGSVLIPAGALSADREITLAVRAAVAGDPNQANLASDIFEFGPNGTVFITPVAMTLPLKIDVPAGKQAVVAWLDAVGGQWFPVPSTMADADKVTGLVSHFTSFAVLLIDEGASCPSAAPCGGTLNGTWTYSASCLKTEPPTAVACGPDAEIPVWSDFSVSGTVAIDGARFTSNQTILVRTTVFYTPECLTAISQGADPAACSVTQANLRAQQQGQQWICSGTPAQGCSCQVTSTTNQTPMGSVTVADQQVTFTEDGKEAKEPSTFCVQGNKLTVQDEDGSLYTAVRQ
jgi:hypothetical protein